VPLCVPLFRNYLYVGYVGVAKLFSVHWCTSLFSLLLADASVLYRLRRPGTELQLSMDASWTSKVRALAWNPQNV